MLPTEKLYLVSGGAGFIGSHLCERLLDNGHKVVCLDNFYPNYDPQVKWDNIKDCQKHPRFELVEADIRDAETIEDIFARYAFDAVFHLAALAGVRPSIQNPQLYADVNIMGTLNMLNAAKNSGVKRFIFASSSSIYGNNPSVPFSETDMVDNPISPYAATKKAGELLCHNYHHLYDLSIVCLRFFTVYGPRQRPDLAIHKFCELMQADQPIPVFGDGSSSRDYTYIDDIIDGVCASLAYTEEHTGYEIINLGRSNTVSLTQMISTLQEVMGRQAKIMRMPMQAGDVSHTFANVEKAQRLLGYDPKTTLKEGMVNFVRWKAENYPI